MITVILVIHLLLAIAMVGTVLLQRSEGGGLGMGGGGGMGGFMTGRDTANLLTRTTAILAAGFMTTSLILAVMAGGGRTSEPTSIMDRPATEQTAPAAPTAPALPKAPLAK